MAFDAGGWKGSTSQISGGVIIVMRILPFGRIARFSIHVPTANSATLTGECEVVWDTDLESDLRLDGSAKTTEPTRLARRNFRVGI